MLATVFPFCVPVLFTFVALSAAQAPTPRFVHYRKPLRTVTLDLETGAVTRGPRVAQRALATTVDFTNLDLSGFVSVDSGGGFCEWIDSARKGRIDHGNVPVPSDLVSNFVFAYCSQAQDTSSGGPGGTATWTFYPSFTTGQPHPTTSSAVGAFTLTGLPANTLTSCVFGLACFFINIQFGSVPLPFADGQIGYSWTFQDLCPGSPLAATFPFLSCVASCSGPGPDGQGMDSLLDRYCPAGVSGAPPLSTFSFGTTGFGGYFTSINLDIREVDVDATVTTYQGTTPGSITNPDALSTSPVVIGSSWTASVTAQPARTNGSPLGGFFLVRVTNGGAPATSVLLDLSAFLAGQCLLPPGSDAPDSQLLTTGSLLGFALGNWSSATPASIPIPLDTSFLCMPWFAQAAVFGDLPGDGDVEADAMFTAGAMGLVGAQ